MALDYSNERYVRLYTRDTTTWKLLSWQARTVLLHLLRKVDRAGVLDVGDDGVDGLAAVLELPLELVEPGIAQLTDTRRGVVVSNGRAYVLPNFLAAQEARASDKQRQRDLRERRRAEAMDVTERDASRDSSVTPRDETITRGHTASHDVTPSLAEPSLAKPREEGEREREAPALPADAPVSAPAAPPAPSRSGQGKRRKAKPSEHTPDELAIAGRVLGKITERTGVEYQGSREHLRLIVGRLRDGVDEWDLRAVVAYCWHDLDWSGKPEMRAYLRPETLFGPQTIERYLAPARTAYAHLRAERDRARAPPPPLRLISTE